MSQDQVSAPPTQSTALAAEKRGQRMPSRIKGLWQAIRPGPRAWRGATFGVLAMALCLLVAANLWLGNTGLWLVGAILFAAVMLLLTVALSDLIVAILKAIPPLFRAALIGGSVVVTLFMLRSVSPAGAIVLLAAVFIPAALIGAAVWTLARGGRRHLDRRRRSIAVAGLAVGAAALVAAAAWYVWPGPPVPPVVNAAALGQTSPPALAASDPAQPGPYAVSALSYGSGVDQRPEFGTGAALTTQPVDGSAFVGNWQGLSGMLRTRYWGFDVTRLPLNGRVWRPQGQGPFPLALVVHGNHHMMNVSDPGYEYLGQLLASRGMIVVSVDQNFLNTSWTDYVLFGMPNELHQENDARGWLLLEHLAQWREWNQTPGNPFYGQVDMSRIALIGHSRGGEAVAIAAAFNRLPYYPDDANVAFDYDFDIRAVIAIAPSDGQYRPAQVGTPLRDVSYLLLHGAYDADVRWLIGIRQYNRVSFSAGSDWFKAVVYVDRANHGHFNTRWGISDLGGFPARGLLNLAPIMAGEEQRQAAQVLISAFLEATLNQDERYRPLFRDLRSGQAWLPDGVYLGRYDDAHMHVLANFEEDIDLTTASVAGVTLVGENLTRWYERRATLKRDDQGSNAVHLGWDVEENSATAWYGLTLSPEALPPGASALSFLMAAGERGDEPLDLSVELWDRGGQTARLPLSHIAPLQPQIAFITHKAALLMQPGARVAEPFLQSYIFPLADFQAANPAFDPARLAAIRFVFDRSPAGLVLLDDVGLRVEP